MYSFRLMWMLVCCGEGVALEAKQARRHQVGITVILPLFCSKLPPYSGDIDPGLRLTWMTIDMGQY